PDDYTATSGTLTILAGNTTGTINVAIINDVLDENTETFTVDLSNPSNATIADNQGVGTINDNDIPPTITISDETENEDVGTMSFTVTLSEASSKDISVDFTTSDGTAGAPDDYTATSGTLAILAGSTTGTIDVTIIDDALIEDTETFTVDLSNPVNATIADNQGVGTILDNDGLVCDLSVDPDSWDFGDVEAGTFVDKMFVLSNSPNATANCVGSGSLTGDPEFTIVSGKDFDIAPGETHELVVRFACPGDPGDPNATLRLESDDPDGPIDVPLTGNCVILVCDLSVDPGSWDFGDVESGTFVEKKFILTNAQSATANCQGSGDLTGAPEFSIVKGKNFDIVPGETHKIVVRFDCRESGGDPNATLRLSSNDPDGPIDVPLTGNCAFLNVPDIAAIPTLINFGNTNVGSSKEKSFKLLNEGPADLEVSSTQLAGSNASEFEVSNADAPFVLQPGESRDITVFFKPNTGGEKTARIKFFSNDPDENPFLVKFRGTSLGEPGVPDIAVKPDSLDFGDVDVGTELDLKIMVSNEGSADLEVSATDLTGADTDQWTVTKGAAPFTLAPGDSQEVTVCFNPTSAGAKNATLQILSNDPDENPFDVPLTGNGIDGGPIEPDIAVAPDSLNFGDVEVGQELDLMMMVYNEGSADLTVDSTNVSGQDSDQWKITAGGAPFTLAPGDSQKVTVCFNPASTGAKSATLQIHSNDPDESPLDLPLNGSGFVSQVQELTITFGEGDDVDFSDVTSDAFLDKRKDDFNMGATKFIRVGNSGSPNTRPYRFLIKFDFIPGLLSSGVTDASQIVDAWIELNVYSSEGDGEEGLSIDARKLYRDWEEGNTDYSQAKIDEVTWNAAKHNNVNWTEAGAGDVTEDRDAIADDTKLVNSTGPVTWDVKSSVIFMFENNSNSGWLLQSQDENKDKYYRLYSSEHRKTSRRPKLTVIVKATAPSQAMLNAKSRGKPQERNTDLSINPDRNLMGEQQENSNPNVPTEFRLTQNYPNPFNPDTQIRYELPASGIVTLSIFDIRGQEIRRILNAVSKFPGVYEVKWNGRDNSGLTVSSGLYFYRILIKPQDMSGSPFIQTRKMTLLK
ncbi:MAG: choice-of-anchor D domain-containing protein, partial [bacterium]